MFPGQITAPDSAMHQLPPIDRRPGIIAGSAAELVIVVFTFGGQRRAGRGYCCACAVDCNGNVTAVKVRNTPAANVVLHAKAVGTGGIEITGLSAGGNGAAAGTRTAGRGTART